MNSSRSSKVGLALLALLVAAAVPAAGVSVSDEGVPEEASLGEQVSGTFTLTELYTNQTDSWTLTGTTELQNVTWTVKLYNQADRQLGETHESTGQSFSQDISVDDDVAKVVVTVTGTVPDSESAVNWSYDPAQSMTMVAFDGGQPGGATDPIDNATFQPTTQKSQEARSAIDAAKSAIESAESSGAGVSSAQDLLESAVNSYDNGNFQTAIDVASNAESQAESAKQSSEQTSLLLKVGGGIVVLAVLAAIVYVLLQRRQTYDKLG